MKRIAIFAVIAFIFTLLLMLGATYSRSDDGNDTMFASGALGGGGFVTAMDISSDGTTRLIRTDVYGAYVWNASSSQWQQVITASTMPLGTPLGRRNLSYSVSEIRAAPSLPTRLYMVATDSRPGAQGMTLWRSDDRGKHWRTTNKAEIGASHGGNSRIFGPKMAIDPANPDVVYFSNDAGIIFRTFDGGSSWERVAALIPALTRATTTAMATGNDALTFEATPSAIIEQKKSQQMWAYDVTSPFIMESNLVLSATASTVKLAKSIGRYRLARGDTIAFGSGPVIAFDPTSGTTGGRTNTMFVGWATGATAVWRTTDAGRSFVSIGGGPASVRHFAVSNDGVLYAVDNSSNGHEAWRYRSGIWVNLPAKSDGLTGNSFNSVAVDPLNTGHLALAQSAGNIQVSDDYGDHWRGFRGVAKRVAIDVPWLANTKEDWMSNGDIKFDPVKPGRLWAAEGIGVWWTKLSTASEPLTWHSQTKGNDELIVDQIIVPPGGTPLVAVQDRGIFYLRRPDIYPSIQGPSNAVAISHGWALDYAKSNSTYIIGIVGNYTWFSEDRGKTWKKNNQQAPGVNMGGAIAAATPQNSVWFPSNNGTPAFTTDGGRSWENSHFGGPTLSRGWGFSLYLNRHIVTADFVQLGTYYAYNYESGVWRSTDGGANWSNVHSISGLNRQAGADAVLTAVPGYKGHLFFAPGSLYGSSNGPLSRSCDGGETWTALTNTSEVWQVAIGRAAPGRRYPAIYITGYVSGDQTPGVFRADDAKANCSAPLKWKRLTSAPAESLDYVKTIAASQDTFGTIYLGFAGSGYAYGKLSNTSSVH